MKKYQELTDKELSTMGTDALCAAYKELRAHHITETTALINRGNGICNHNWSVWVAAEGPIGDARGYHRYCTEPGCQSREYSRHLAPPRLVKLSERPSSVREMLLQKKDAGETEAERWADNFAGQCRKSCAHTAQEHVDAKWHLACAFKDLLAEVRAARAAGYVDG